MEDNNMKRLVLIVWMLAIIGIDLYGQKPAVLPSPSQVKWADAEVGVLIHYGLWVYKSSDEGSATPLSAFNPSKLSTDQWVKAAKSAGATYAVLTVKHGPGFCFWPTKVPGYDYHIGNTPYKGGKGDVARDFVNSCKKYGIKPGFYYCIGNNSNHYLRGKNIPTKEELEKYNQLEYQHLTELWNNYGKLFEIWFDGGVVEDKKAEVAVRISELLKKYQPEAITFQGPVDYENNIRWSGNEDGRGAYPNWSRADQATSPDGNLISIPKNGGGNPDGKYWAPAEADMANRKNSGWGWYASKDYDEKHPPYSSDELLEHYYNSTGRNANLMIGMAIDSSGSFPESNARIFEEFGNKLKQRLQSTVGSVSGKGNSVTIKLPKAQDINQIEIREDITKGERIRSYVVEAFLGGNWKLLCDGSSVSHKRIQLFDKVKVSEVRLTITKSEGEPIIKKFAVFNY